MTAAATLRKGTNMRMMMLTTVLTGALAFGLMTGCEETAESATTGAGEATSAMMTGEGAACESCVDKHAPMVVDASAMKAEESCCAEGGEALAGGEACSGGTCGDGAKSEGCCDEEGAATAGGEGCSGGACSEGGCEGEKKTAEPTGTGADA